MIETKKYWAVVDVVEGVITNSLGYPILWNHKDHAAGSCDWLRGERITPVAIVPWDELHRLQDFRELVLKHAAALEGTSLKSLSALLKEEARR